jgi:plastocyanin
MERSKSSLDTARFTLHEKTRINILNTSGEKMIRKILAPLFMIALALLTLGSVQAGTVSAIHSHVQGHVMSETSSPVAVQASVIDFGGLVIGNAYSPANVFIKPGENVKWQGDFTIHPLVSDEGLWTTVNSGTQFEFIFNTPGVYHFHCLIHGPFGMTGTVTVGYRVFIPDVLK